MTFHILTYCILARGVIRVEIDFPMTERTLDYAEITGAFPSS